MKLEEKDCSSFRGGDRVAILLVAGQSNAANFGGIPYTPRKPVYQLFGNSCFQAKDPLVGAGGDRGSVWTRLADKLVQGGNFEEVIIVPVAIEGSKVIQWAYAGEHHPLLNRALLDLLEKGLQPTYFLWHQGEADASAGTTEASYVAYFNNMIDRLRKVGLTAPVYVSVATRCALKKNGKIIGGKPSLEIQRAQQSIPDLNRQIFLGPNTDKIYKKSDRIDGCHFSNQGLEKFAQAWVDVLIINEKK